MRDVVSLLIVYSRGAGRIIREQQYTDRHEAFEERWRVERDLQRDSCWHDTEVVVLDGDVDTMHRTHARYWM